LRAKGVVHAFLDRQQNALSRTGWIDQTGGISHSYPELLEDAG